MSKKTKKRFGDRRDAVLIRDADPMHSFMPYLLLGRTDNEAVLNDEVDLTAVTRYLEEKNASSPDFKYTIFHVVLAAIAKTVYLRPAMNRFLQGHRTYQRNDINFSFVVKRAFSDTTIMASAGSQSNHLNHVSTQLPYALTVAGVSFVSYILTGLMPKPSAWIMLPVSIVLMVGTLMVIRMFTKKAK